MSRPYFETKVVKVKKEEKQKYCPCCGGKIEMEKPKGNWVNDENLDAIKFPCFCSYQIGESKKLGQINTDFFKGYTQYTLSIIDRQVGNSETTSWVRYDSLKLLIRDYNVHILKGKIILFEEKK